MIKSERKRERTRWALGVLAAFCLLFSSGVCWALSGLQPGMKTPVFTLESLEGGTVSLSDFPRGRLFVIVFWSTWSENSGAELERLEQLYRKHKDEGLVVIGISVENQTISSSDIAGIKKMARNLKLSFPILLDKGLTTFYNYGVVAVPSTVVADKSWTILFDLAAYPIVGREDLFEFIEATMEGREVRKKVVKMGYQPLPKAIRFYNLARAMGGRGVPISIEEHLKKAIETDPKFVLPYILLGQVFKEQALFEDAIEYNGEVKVLAKGDRKKLVEAAVYLNKALELDANNREALTELASIRIEEGKTAEAKKILEKVLQIDSFYTPAHSYRAVALLKEGNVKGAQEEYATAGKLNPLDYKVHYVLAQAFEEKGMFKEALEAYKKGLDILWVARGQLYPLSWSRQGL